MKKIAILMLTLMTMLLASFAFVGGASADEGVPHLCMYTGVGIPPGFVITIEVHDVNGNLVYSETLDATNSSDPLFSDHDVSYLTALNGILTITLTAPGFGTFSVDIPANELGNGECFDDGRLNSRPDRDLAAPVAIYIRFAEDGDGFDGYDVYDINQFAGTGTVALHVTEDELNEAYDQALATGANVTVAQQDDIIFTLLGSSTADAATCQVNAVDQEGKPYEYSWVCLG